MVHTASPSLAHILTRLSVAHATKLIPPFRSKREATGLVALKYEGGEFAVE